MSGTVRLGKVRWGKGKDFMNTAKIKEISFEPGMMISLETCERIIGFHRSGNEYQFGFELMKLQGLIEKTLRKQGKFYSVVVEKGSIRILTERESSVYNARTFEIGKRKLRKSFKRIQFVDVSKLSESERVSHTKNLINQSRQIQAMRQTQIEIKLTEHKRTTPIRLE